jgi:hypothetical protein
VLSGGGSGEAATSHSTGAANVRFGSLSEAALRLSALSYTNPVSPKSNAPPTSPSGPLGQVWRRQRRRFKKQQGRAGCVPFDACARERIAFVCEFRARDA